METIDILKAKFGNKHDAAETEPAPRVSGEAVTETDAIPGGPRPGTWRQSAALVALSDFLKPRPWVRLVEYADAADRSDGYGLRFEPGISPRYPDQWADATHAMILLADAMEDIEHLRGIGRLPLPRVESPHPDGQPAQPPAGSASTGPSGEVENTGVHKAPGVANFF